jgi:Methyltransferase domain
MSNPWLGVPLAEYEQHMKSPGVQQLCVMSDLFGEALGYCQPTSVAILGIAGGNGLEHVDSNLTGRVVGLDVNPQYLETVKQRYSHVSGVELYCADLAEQTVNLAPVQLVHAALVFEHAGTNQCLDNAVSLTARGGCLSVVLQLPSECGQAVGASEFLSVQRLKSSFALIDRGWLCETLARRGFRLTRETTRALPAGKAFWIGTFCLWIDTRSATWQAIK